MAFSANFFDAYNTEKTNIRKRRKENAEMFEAYKDAKVADGEEVSVEELSNMRSNLAGGDFYFGQALPAEKHDARSWLIEQMKELLILSLLSLHNKQSRHKRFLRWSIT